MPAFFRMAICVGIVLLAAKSILALTPAQEAAIKALAEQQATAQQQQLLGMVKADLEDTKNKNYQQSRTRKFVDDFTGAVVAQISDEKNNKNPSYVVQKELKDIEAADCIVQKVALKAVAEALMVAEVGAAFKKAYPSHDDSGLYVEFRCRMDRRAAAQQPAGSYLPFLPRWFKSALTGEMFQ